MHTHNFSFCLTCVRVGLSNIRSLRGIFCASSTGVRVFVSTEFPSIASLTEESQTWSGAKSSSMSKVRSRQQLALLQLARPGVTTALIHPAMQVITDGLFSPVLQTETPSTGHEWNNLRT
jgi:hypothetical protein